MKVKEIFYSLQGEGAHTGTPAVFIRFAGCNLKCPFCDTDFKNGTEMSVEEIVKEVTRYPTKHVILTGGEPTLQINEELIDALHFKGKFIHIETNGTHEIELPIDWITCSPKFDFCPHAEAKLTHIDELKIVYQEQDMSRYDNIEAKMYYVQPCDYGDETENKRNVNKVIKFIKENPKWRMSLQTQKILNVL